MKHFIFEEREYEIEPRFRSPVKRENYRAGLKTFRRLAGGGAGIRVRNNGGGWKRRSIDDRQNCVVKMHYSKKIGAHRAQIYNYIKREGTGRDGGEAKIYGTDFKEYVKNIDAKNIRIFLSPQSRDVNLEVLARSFIKRLETQTGHKLYWLAAEHYNTEHPHAHIIINGTDENGRSVMIPPDIVKKYMRESARDICTAMTGSRTPSEMKAEREKQAYADRWTKLDEQLKEITIGNRIYLEYAEDSGRKNLLINRIGHLQGLGLCAWNKYHYEVIRNWEVKLKIQGRYNCYLGAREELEYTDKLNLALYNPAMHGVISGRVTKIYKTDEVSDNHAVLLEGIDGRAYFVPLFYAPKGLSERDAVSISAYPGQEGRLLTHITQRTLESLEGQIKKEGLRNPLADTVVKIMMEEKARGTAACYLKAHEELKYTNELNLEMYDPEKHGRISGRVTKIYKTDNLSDNHAVLLESINGRAYFVPLSNKLKDIEERDAVSISAWKNKKGITIPFITQRTLESLEREIKKEDLRNPLADAVMKGMAEIRVRERDKCYLEAREELKYTNKADLLLYEPSEHGAVSGRVTKIYKTDVEGGIHAVLLEGIDGKAYFVPMIYAPKDVEENDTVSIKAWKNKKGVLLPLINQQTMGGMEREIKKGGWRNPLADRVVEAVEEARARGIENCYLEARRELKYTNELYLSIYDPEKHGKISGRVTKIYKTDEVSGNHAILLEGIDGSAYFVPLSNKPKDVEENDAVSIKTWKTRDGTTLPYISQQTMEGLEREIQRKGWRNPLADTVVKVIEELKRQGRDNCYFKAHQELKYTNKLYLSMYDPEKHGRISGRVTKIYKTDEVSGSHAVLLEGIDGKAYFVPLSNKPKNVEENDAASVKAWKNREGIIIPYINQRTMGSLEREIKKESYNNPLANEVVKVMEEAKTQGINNCYLGAWRELKYTNKLNMTMYDPEKHGRISGRVTKIYKTDSVSDNHAILLECIDGKAYFIPLSNKAEGVEEKDAVSLKAWKNRNGITMPFINQITMESLEREIKKEGRNNPLADAVVKAVNEAGKAKGAGYGGGRGL